MPGSANDTARSECLAILAGRIAHELESVLNSVLSSLSLAAVLVPGNVPCAEGLLREAEKGALRARNLTSQLSAFSDTGEPRLRLSYLRKLIEDSSRFSLIGTEASCDFRLPLDLWPAKVDAKQFALLITSLLMHALSANDDRGEVVVGAENLTLADGNSVGLEPGNYVRIVVRDSGGGLPEKRLEEAFDPLSSSGHFGVALAACNMIVGRHGGMMVARSLPGLGSAFSVYIPAIPDGVPSGQEAYAPLSSGRVLVMDDDQWVLQVAREMLSHLGYSVVTTCDGREAIGEYSRLSGSGGRFDAVLMDLCVPGGMGGIEALAGILEVDPEARVIVSSGHFSLPVMWDFRSRGFAAALAKPYSLSMLAGALSEATGAGREESPVS
ncbi:response regulator [Candidatus Fermentibacterales bacterium]|nr:response regulator [Candidatus Fermentibacterales bacterium]